MTPRLEENDAIANYLFGYTIKAINGAVECREKYRDSERLRVYNEILARWSITTDRPGKMTGCLPDLPPIVSRNSTATTVIVPTTLTNSMTETLMPVSSVPDPDASIRLLKFASRTLTLIYG